MIRINLLPFRDARRKETARKQVGIFLLTMAVVLGLLLVVHFYLKNQEKSLQTRVKSTKAQLAKYEKINKEITAIKKKLEILKKKTDVIKSLEANRRQAVELLDAFTRLVIKKRMWFTRLESHGSLSGTVRILGIAMDNKTVADFMTRLEKSGLFASVQLKNLQKHTIKENQSIDLKKFEIDCQRIAKNPVQTDKKKKKAKKK